jgi:prepilin peptidase CpaA
MYIGIWSVLFAIVVFDAKECRIPNKLVVLLLAVVFGDLYIIHDGLLNIPSQYWLGGVVAFLVCFALYLGRLMGAGDVKLIGALGFWVGLESLLPFASAIILMGAVQSIFYLAQKLAISQLHIKQHVNQYLAHNIYGRLTRAPIDAIEMRIPFAPAIVVALAVYPIIG